jgi:hypothetical protein
MARVRGRSLIDAVGFVRESFGDQALARVSAELEPAVRAVFEGTIRPTAWYELDDFLGYLLTARRVLAPQDEDFFRRQGRYAGRYQRSAHLGIMVDSLETMAKMAPTIWRMFYDVGRLVAVDGSRGRVGQIHDFPATPELCQRFLGIWEGLASTPERTMVAEETLCVRRGDPCCEILLRPAG